MDTIETKFFQLGSKQDPFRFRDGSVAPGPLTLAYETYGELNADRSNAILLFHAFSGSHHAAGHNPSVPGTDDRWAEELHTGWWDSFIGPRKALDTNQFCVICVNFLGGCYGSSGPASPHPVDGRPWGSRFPGVRVEDIVRSQASLLDHLGIHRLHAAIGPSVGGSAALTFANLFPDRVRYIIPIASGFRTSVLNRMILLEQILAIENDPHFKGGEYYDSTLPRYGLALARMISHKTFVHLNTIERRASRDIRQQEDKLAWYRLHDKVESYILYQGTKFVERFDANTYLRISEMWSRYDPVVAAGADSIKSLLAPSREHGHHFLVFSIDSDSCFYPEEQAELVQHLKDNGVSCMHITTHSEKGHDSFLLEPALYTPHLYHTLSEAWTG